MHVVDFLAEIPNELWGTLFGGIAATIGSVVAVAKKIKDKIAEERKNISIEEEKKRSALIKAVAEVTAKTVNTEIDTALEARHYTRSEQIQVARNALEIYADSILTTADSATKTMIDPSDQKFDLVKSLYMDAIKNSFIGDVHQFFIRIISKNGFMEKSESEFITWTRETLAPAAYKVWRGSMLRRFENEQIRDRVKWSDENTDVMAMKDMVQSFMMECRSMSEEYYAKRSIHAENLSMRIESDIITAFTTTKI